MRNYNGSPRKGRRRQIRNDGLGYRCADIPCAVKACGFDNGTRLAIIFTMSEQFPSGPWLGFYTYDSGRDRHRMDLSLEFGKGMIGGEGTDDIGPFVVRGRYNTKSKECHWTKTYVGMHDVFYSGIRQGKGIHGTWEVGRAVGGFKVWPLASGADGDEAEPEENLQPEEVVEAVDELVGAK